MCVSNELQVRSGDCPHGDCPHGDCPQPIAATRKTAVVIIIPGERVTGSTLRQNFLIN